MLIQNKTIAKGHVTDHVTKMPFLDFAIRRYLSGIYLTIRITIACWFRILPFPVATKPSILLWYNALLMLKFHVKIELFWLYIKSDIKNRIFDGQIPSYLKIWKMRFLVSSDAYSELYGDGSQKGQFINLRSHKRYILAQGRKRTVKRF